MMRIDVRSSRREPELQVYLFLVLFPLVLFAAQIVGTALHEFGHALAGRLMGISIREIRIGRTPWLFSLRFFDTTLRVGKIIDSGCVIPYWHPQGNRARNIVFTAGGPATDLLILALAIWSALAEKVPPAFLWVPVLVAVVQARLLYRNIVLHAGVTNDIRIILDEWRSMGDRTTEFREFYRRSLSTYGDEEGGNPELSHHSPRVGTLIYQPLDDDSTVLDSERLADLERQLQRPLPKAETLLILDHLASQVLFEWRLDLAPKLDCWTRQALDLAPDIATLRGSRGAALCILGRFEEAESMLKQADYSNEFNRLLNHLFLAWACHGRGAMIEARQHWDEATVLNAARIKQEGDRLDRVAQHVGARIGLAGS